MPVNDYDIEHLEYVCESNNVDICTLYSTMFGW